MMKYNGRGGSVPRETTIAGQRHMLAYINPFELDLLQQYNASPNVYGPGGIPAYPGNAAAEGGFGLGAGDAFGGGGGGGSSSGGSSAGSSGASAGGGNAGASAGGGNSSGGGEGPGGYDAFGNGYATAAEAAAADAAAEAAAAGANVSASASFGGGYSSPATGAGTSGGMGGGGVGGYDAFGNGYATAAAAANADAVAEIGAYLGNIGINPSSGTSPGSTGISPSMGFGLTSDPLGSSRADTNPTAPAISPGYSMSMAPPSLDTPTLSSAPAVDTSTPAAPAVPGLTQSDMFAIDEAVLDALADDTTPSLASSNVSTNVSPSTIAVDTATTSTGTTPSSLNLSDKISMGIIAFGKNRAKAADDMFAKGYTAEQIGDYFSSTDATVAANEAAIENSMGARDDLAMDLDPCPEGFFLDPVSKVCVVKTVAGTDADADAAGDTSEEDTTPSWEPVTPEIPMSLPSQTAFSPYTIPGGVGTTALQPYPGMGAGARGLAAAPSPNQAGIIQMAPTLMQPAPPPLPLPLMSLQERPLRNG